MCGFSVEELCLLGAGLRRLSQGGDEVEKLAKKVEDAWVETLLEEVVVSCREKQGLRTGCSTPSRSTSQRPGR
jgi:hypothetical protein